MTTRRQFSCYPQYMRKTLLDAFPSRGFANENGHIVVQSFFELIVKSREGLRFDVHGNEEYNQQYRTWAKGDSIEFHVQNTDKTSATATLEQYVRGAHADADPKSIGHFFLTDIQLPK